MKLINDFNVVNPQLLGANGQNMPALHIYCPDHPLWEPMEYRLVPDDFKCTALERTCTRKLGADEIYRALVHSPEA